MGFVLLAVLIVVLLYVFVALGFFAIFAAVLVGLLAILNDHRKVYFSVSSAGIFRYLAYGFAIIIMIKTTLCFTPRIERVFPTMWPLPDPFSTAFSPLFFLGVFFLLWSMKPANPNAKPMQFTGAVLADQLKILASAPFVIFESIKRSFAVLVSAHWITGIGGLLVLLLSIPVGIIAFTSGTLAVFWFAIVWAGFALIVLVPARLAFNAMHHPGFLKTCSGCGKEHPITGPGPLGVVQINCLCGQKINIWTNAGSASTEPLSEKTFWKERPYQAGTRPLIVLGAVVMVCMLLRSFGVWDGPIRKIPWAKDVEMEELNKQSAELPLKASNRIPNQGSKDVPQGITK